MEYAIEQGEAILTLSSNWIASTSASRSPNSTYPNPVDSPWVSLGRMTLVT